MSQMVYIPRPEVFLCLHSTIEMITPMMRSTPAAAGPAMMAVSIPSLVRPPASACPVNVNEGKRETKESESALSLEHWEVKKYNVTSNDYSTNRR